MLDEVKEIAKKVLMLSSYRCENDNFLWERSQRLVNNISLILSLPEVAEKAPELDKFSLTAAAYFSEAGLATFLKSEMGPTNPKNGVRGSQKNSPLKVIPNLSAAGDYMVYQATEVLNEHLKDLVEKKIIEKISAIIIQSYENGQQSPEAMVLSDARNLDDMGVVGIFNDLKSYFFAGKGINNLLKSWDSKIDYAYWQSRLDESFYFDSVREIARKRLYAAHFFMKQLKIETRALDVEKFIKRQRKKQ
jgi:hypothetical protein